MLVIQAKTAQIRDVICEALQLKSATRFSCISIPELPTQGKYGSRWGPEESRSRSRPGSRAAPHEALLMKVRCSSSLLDSVLHRFLELGIYRVYDNVESEVILLKRYRWILLLSFSPF